MHSCSFTSYLFRFLVLCDTADHKEVGFVRTVMLYNGATDDHPSLSKVSEKKKSPSLRENILKKESWHVESFLTQKLVVPHVVVFIS